MDEMVRLLGPDLRIEAVWEEGARALGSLRAASRVLRAALSARSCSFSAWSWKLVTYAVPPPLPNVMCSWKEASLLVGSPIDRIDGLLRFGVRPTDGNSLGVGRGLLEWSGVLKSACGSSLAAEALGVLAFFFLPMKTLRHYIQRES